MISSFLLFWKMLAEYETVAHNCDRKELIQGDHSGCDKPPVDFKTKVAFQYMGLIIKQNFCYEVNGRFDTTRMVTL